MSKSRKKLERAYKLIKRDKVDDALKVLRPIVEAEPENPDAWWIMAYALQEPEQIREALLQVLEFDHEDKHTQEAQALLQKLNSQYPPTTQELMRHPELSTYSSPFPGLSAEQHTSALETVDAFTVDDDPFAAEISDDFFSADDSSIEAQLFGDSDDPLFSSEPPAGDMGNDDLRALFEDDESQPVQSADVDSDDSDSSIFDTEALFPDEGLAQNADADILTDEQIEARAIQSGLRPEDVDEDIRARIEEGQQVGERSRSLRRILIPLVAVLAVVVLIVVLIVVLGQDEAEADLDQLEPVASDASQVDTALAEAMDALQAAGLGTQPEALVAEGSLGSTLFVQFCTKPVPDLAQRAFQGMDIAARQASLVRDEVNAVGVSVNACAGATRDVLYRASVAVEDAESYVDGGLGNGDVGRSNFQNLWHTP